MASYTSRRAPPAATAAAGRMVQVVHDASGTVGLLTLLRMRGMAMQAILNDKNSPELLPYQSDVVDELQALVQRQGDAVEDLERDAQQELKRLVYSLELKRVRFMLRLYLRTRLHKIEAQAAHILDSDALIARLSPLEQQYLQDYFVLLGVHLNNSVLSSLPEDFKPLLKAHDGLSDGNDLVAHPPLDRHVFCNVLTDISEPVPVDETTELDMKAGDLFIIRYEQVAPLVERGQAVLV